MRSDLYKIVTDLCPDVIGNLFLRTIAVDDNDIFSYEEILKISSQYAKQSSDTQELLDRIKSLIEINPNYYVKIKEFIDEL